MLMWVETTDASKVPPSQFQRRKGSIYSTPSSRDSQHNNQERDKAYHEKLKEKVSFLRFSLAVGLKRPVFFLLFEKGLVERISSG